MKSKPDLEEQLLVTCALSRQLGHETGNFLHNMDLAVHGLKSERLSPRGEKILRLLADESVRVKCYMRNGRQFFRTPEISREMLDMEDIIENAAGKWQKKQNGAPIQTSYIWAPRSAMVLAHRKLMEKAIVLVLESVSESVSDNPALKIHGNLADDNMSVAIVSLRYVPTSPEKIAAYGPFTEDGHLSKVFTAKAIIEAHGGTLCCRGKNPEKQEAFEIFLPCYRPHADERSPGEPESHACP